MNDTLTLASNAGTAAPGHAAAPRRRAPWAGRLLWLAALGAALVVVLVLLAQVATTAPGFNVAVPHITLDGEEFFNGFDTENLSALNKLLLAGVLLVALLAAVVVLPVLLLAAVLGLVVLALALVALPLMVLLLLAALVMSPVLLVLWLLWRLIAS